MRATKKALHVYTIFNQTGTMANQGRATRYNTMLNFFYINWALIKRVMYISSNEVPSQNQLAIRRSESQALYASSST